MLYLIKNIFNFPQHTRKIKWAIQRAIRGWADCDTWNFDVYISKLISEGLIYLSANKHGFPSILQKKILNKDLFEDISEEENELCAKAWKEILLDTANLFKKLNEWEELELKYLENNVTGYKDYLLGFFDRSKSYNKEEWKEAMSFLKQQYRKLLFDIFKSLKWFKNWWD